MQVRQGGSHVAVGVDDGTRVAVAVSVGNGVKVGEAVGVCVGVASGGSVMVGVGVNVDVGSGGSVRVGVDVGQLSLPARAFAGVTPIRNREVIAPMMIAKIIARITITSVSGTM